MGQPKKILIVSDTHRKNENYFALLKQLEPLDMVIHCGDAEVSERISHISISCICVFNILFF